MGGQRLERLSLLARARQKNFEENQRSNQVDRAGTEKAPWTGRIAQG
jgi:hypothetical protein